MVRLCFAVLAPLVCALAARGPAADPQPRLVLGHGVQLFGASAYSADGSRFVVRGTEFDALWDTKLNRRVAALPGNKFGGGPVRFSADGALVASVGETGLVRLFDAATGKPKGELKVLKNGAAALAFSADGTALTVANAIDGAAVYDVATGKQLKELKPFKAQALEVVLNATGDRLVITGGWNDFKVRIWDVPNDKQLHAFSGNFTFPRQFAFAPDSKSVAFADKDEVLFVWDFAAGQQHKLKGHSGRVSALVFSADGTTLFSGAHDRTVRAWDLAKGTSVLRRELPVITALALDAKNKRLAASGGTDVRFFDSATLEDAGALPGHKGYVSGLAVSADRKTIASTDEAHITLWDATTWREVRTIPAPRNGIGRYLALPTDDTVLATDTANLFLLDAKTGDVRKKVECGFVLSSSYHENPVAVASGGAVAVTRGTTKDNKPTVAFWDLKTGTSTDVVLDRFFPRAFGFGPDGKLLRVEAYGSFFTVTNQAQPPKPVLAPADELTPDVASATAFSADGALFAQSWVGGKVRLWNPATGKKLATLEGHDGLATLVAFSPNGKRLAVTDDTRTRVWDTATHKLLTHFPAPAAQWKRALVFLDDRTLLTGGFDRVISVWDVPAGK